MRSLLFSGVLCATFFCAGTGVQAAGGYGPRIGGVQLGQTIQEAQQALQNWHNASLAVEGPDADGSMPSIHVSLQGDDLCANLFFNTKNRLENFTCWGSCLRALSKGGAKAGDIVQSIRGKFALPDMPHKHLPSEQGQPPEELWQHADAGQHWELSFRMDENLMMNLRNSQ